MKKSDIIGCIFFVIEVAALCMLAYTLVHRTGWESQLLCAGVAAAAFSIVEHVQSEYDNDND